jgi:F-type H+-transporting ATPase subunit epsilon
VAEAVKTFQCTVIAPQGKILDCRAASVIIPAHDGQLGILPGHMPLFCQLGTGVMEVKSPATETASPVEHVLIIDGGFAMFNSNNLAVTAAQGVNVLDIKPEKYEMLIESCKARLADPELTPGQRGHEERRLSLFESFRQRVGVNSPE